MAAKDHQPYLTDLRDAISCIVRAIDHRPSESVFSALHFFRSELTRMASIDAVCTCCGGAFFRASSPWPRQVDADGNPLPCINCGDSPLVQDPPPSPSPEPKA